MRKKTKTFNPEKQMTIRKKDLPPPTKEVKQCAKCTRMYLPQLGCLFCEVYDVNAKKLIYK